MKEPRPDANRDVGLRDVAAIAEEEETDAVVVHVDVVDGTVETVQRGVADATTVIVIVEEEPIRTILPTEIRNDPGKTSE